MHLSFGAESDEQRRGIGVRLGEAEIAAQGAAGAHAHVGDFGFHLGEHRQVLFDDRRTLDGAMGGRAADHERAVLNFDLVQIGNRFDIDQMLVAEQIMLHREQKLGAAGIEPALLTEFGEHLRSFSDRFRLVNGESS